MTISIKPLSSIEEEVYGRVIANIPPGDFYLRAQYVQPRRDGSNRVPFVITGYIGHNVEVYLNEAFIGQIGMTATQYLVSLDLQPPPDINYLRIIDTVTQEQYGTSVVVANYASVHYGAALDYYRHVWLPLQNQRWSLTSEWSGRLVEFYFKYHQNFPDTNALRTLAVRLTSRATWNNLPTDLGVRNMVGSLCASEPVIVDLTNSRPSIDLALHPLLPISVDYGGSEFNVWIPDFPTSREVALLKLCRSNDALVLKSFEEGHTFLTVNGEPIDLYKDATQANLAHVLQRIGTMDYMRAWVGRDRDIDHYRRFWSSPMDNVVEPPGLGITRPFDDFSTFDSGSTLDSAEPFADLWNGLTVSPLDSSPMDSVICPAVGPTQIQPDQPLAWEWEYTRISATAGISSTVPSNILYGGAPPDYEPT